MSNRKELYKYLRLDDRTIIKIANRPERLRFWKRRYPKLTIQTKN